MWTRAIILACMFIGAAGGIADAQPAQGFPAGAFLGGVADLAPTTTSTATALPSSVTQYPVLLAINDGAAEAFIALGTSNSVTATSASIPIPPGHALAFAIPATDTYVAALSASGTGSLKLIQADGVPDYH